MIEPAWPELRVTVLKMRPDWTGFDADSARGAALNANWTWPRFALEIMRLATDSEATPRDLVRALRRTPSPAGDMAAGLAAVRANLPHHPEPDDAPAEGDH